MRAHCTARNAFSGICRLAVKQIRDDVMFVSAMLLVATGKIDRKVLRTMIAHR